MSTVNVSYTWDTTTLFNAWTYTPGTSVTITNGAGGDASTTCLSVSRAVKAATGANSTATLTGTWEALFGIPSGSRITGVTSASMKSKCTVFTSAGTGNTIGAATLADGGTTVTLSAQRSITATDGAFVASNGTDATSLSLASSDSVTLTINFHNQNANTTGSTVTFLADTLAFTVTYSPFQTLTPGLVDDSANDVFSVPSVAANYTLSPSLYDDTTNFLSPAPTVAPGAVALTPALVSDSDTIYAPTVSSNNTLSPSLYDDTTNFLSPSPTVVAGAVTLTPPLFDEGDTFFAPTVSSIYGLSPALFSDTDTLFAPAVSASNHLTPLLFDEGDTFFAPIVSATDGLAPLLFSETDTYYAATATFANVLTPALATDLDILFAPVASAPGGSASSLGRGIARGIMRGAR